MSVSSSAVSFEILGSTLHILGELGGDDAAGLEAALKRLLETDRRSLTIDVSGVHYVNVGCARRIAEAAAEAGRGGRSVAVRTRKRALHVLQLAGLDRLGTIEFAEDG